MSAPQVFVGFVDTESAGARLVRPAAGAAREDGWVSRAEYSAGAGHPPGADFSRESQAITGFTWEAITNLHPVVRRDTPRAADFSENSPAWFVTVALMGKSTVPEGLPVILLADPVLVDGGDAGRDPPAIAAVTARAEEVGGARLSELIAAAAEDYPTWFVEWVVVAVASSARATAADIGEGIEARVCAMAGCGGNCAAHAAAAAGDDAAAAVPRSPAGDADQPPVVAGFVEIVGDDPRIVRPVGAGARDDGWFVRGACDAGAVEFPPAAPVPRNITWDAVVGTHLATRERVGFPASATAVAGHDIWLVTVAAIPRTSPPGNENFAGVDAADPLALNVRDLGGAPPGFETVLASEKAMSPDVVDRVAKTIAEHAHIMSDWAVAVVVSSGRATAADFGAAEDSAADNPP